MLKPALETAWMNVQARLASTRRFSGPLKSAMAMVAGLVGAFWLVQTHATDNRTLILSGAPVTYTAG